MIKEDVKKIKKIIRERIWKLMEELDIAKFPRPVYGRIPNFIGAEKAAERLCRTSIWRKAEVIRPIQIVLSNQLDIRLYLMVRN